MGFFTDTTVCIGCKACEVACKQWNDLPADGVAFAKGGSYDHTGELSASTWRHVRFIELLEPSPRSGPRPSRRWPGRRRLAAGHPGGRHGPAGRLPGPADGDGARGRRTRRRRGGQDGRLGVHVRRVQALHQRRLPGRLPDRRADPHRARDRRAAARRVQRLRLLRAGVPVRGRRPRPDRRPRGQVHALLRPPGRRAGAGVRQGLSDRLDPVRALRRARRGGLAARGRAAPARGRRPPICTAPATIRTSSWPAAWGRSSCSPSRPSATGFPLTPNLRSRRTSSRRPWPGWAPGCSRRPAPLPPSSWPRGERSDAPRAEPGGAGERVGRPGEDGRPAARHRRPPRNLRPPRAAARPSGRPTTHRDA